MLWLRHFNIKTAPLLRQLKTALNVMSEIERIFRKIESVPDFSGSAVDAVHFRNRYGDTPLHIVSNWGDCEAIQVLVSAGADINSVGETGFTPLHCASEQNHPKAIVLLLALGASIMKDENGETPQSLAELLGNNEAISAFTKSI